MLALPHHADQLEDEGESGAKLLEPEAAAAIPFWTLKGLMAPVVGATWVLHEDLTTIGFRAPAGVRNATMAAAILAQLQIDAKSSMRVHPDTGQLYMDPNGELEKGKADWMVNDPFWGNPYWNGAREELAATAALDSRACALRPPPRRPSRPFLPEQARSSRGSRCSPSSPTSSATCRAASSRSRASPTCSSRGCSATTPTR